MYVGGLGNPFPFLLPSSFANSTSLLGRWFSASVLVVVAGRPRGSISPSHCSRKDFLCMWVGLETLSPSSFLHPFQTAPVCWAGGSLRRRASLIALEVRFLPPIAPVRTFCVCGWAWKPFPLPPSFILFKQHQSAGPVVLCVGACRGRWSPSRFDFSLPLLP